VIFAELQYSGHYEDVHRELEVFLPQHFLQVESGIQGDSWFWIHDGEEKVAINTFTSMKHQVKCVSPGKHVQRVIEALRAKYEVRVYDSPELEGHEDH
jgi:hypothetical protein